MGSPAVLGRRIRAWRRRADQRGIALVAVLWVFILLALIAGSVATTTRSELRIAHNLTAAAHAQAAADAAVHRAVAVIVAQRGYSADWRTDGTPRVIQFDDFDITVTIQDEGGRVDLNAANLDLLRAAFATVPPEILGLDTDADALAAAVVDWRDSDDFTTPRGAEDGEYASLGFPYGAKDAPFEAVDELRQVAGITPKIYAAVEPLLTVYSNSPGIDPSIAPRAVLLALPQFDAASVDALMAGRGGAVPPIASQDAALTPTIIRGAFGKSPRSAFAIIAVAKGQDGAAFTRRAVIYLPPRRTGIPYLYVYWR